MPGSVVDLSALGAKVPSPIVVDTNLIVEWLVVPMLGVAPSSPTVAGTQHASQFFSELSASRGTGIVTPTVFTELVHVAIEFRYKQELSRINAMARQGNGPRIKSWRRLYKQDASILQAFQGDLQRLRSLLVASGLLFLEQSGLGPIPSGREYDEELVHLVGTYGLDSNDAAILMEARRSGVTAIVSLDADMRRARADFDIYTWL